MADFCCLIFFSCFVGIRSTLWVFDRVSQFLDQNRDNFMLFFYSDFTTAYEIEKVARVPCDIHIIPHAAHHAYATHAEEFHRAILHRQSISRPTHTRKKKQRGLIQATQLTGITCLISGIHIQNRTAKTFFGVHVCVWINRDGCNQTYPVPAANT